MDRKEIYSALYMAGFSQGPRNQLFVVDCDLPVTPAYACNIISKKGKFILSGAIGIYVKEFESIWLGSLSSDERLIDRTLPVIMAIENYIELINLGVFDTINEFDDAIDLSLCIYRFCKNFPASKNEFHKALISGQVVGRPVSEYLHIVDYFDDDNLYLRKSVAFIRWIDINWPELSQDMRRCLTRSQLRRLETV